MSLRVSLALLTAGVRHRRDLHRLVDRELDGWEQHASAIPDPDLRGLALEKLHAEGAHARAATMIATLAPRARRPLLARTILATEVLYDYLDGRSETSTGREMLRVFTDACAMRHARVPASAGDHDYLTSLALTVSRGLTAQPSARLVGPQLVVAAQRAADAQTRAHAGGLTAGTWDGWREQLAGAGASVLCVHALALRAALQDGPGPAELDGAYFELATLATLLDGLVDRARGESESPYVAAYDSPGRLIEAVALAGARARTRLHALGPQHEMMLAGLVAHYQAAAPRTPGGACLPSAVYIRGARPAVALASLVL